MIQAKNKFQICFLPWNPFCQLFSLNGFWAVSVNIILRRFTHPKSSPPILRIVSCNPMPPPLGLVYQKITCILSKRDSPWIFVLGFFSPTRQLPPKMEGSGAVCLRYLGSGNTRSSGDLPTLVINNLQVLGWSSQSGACVFPYISLILIQLNHRWRWGSRTILSCLVNLPRLTYAPQK